MFMKNPKYPSIYHPTVVCCILSLSLAAGCDPEVEGPGEFQVESPERSEEELESLEWSDDECCGAGLIEALKKPRSLRSHSAFDSGDLLSHDVAPPMLKRTYTQVADNGQIPSSSRGDPEVATMIGDSVPVLVPLDDQPSDQRYPEDADQAVPLAPDAEMKEEIGEDSGFPEHAHEPKNLGIVVEKICIKTPEPGLGKTPPPSNPPESPIRACPRPPRK